LNLSHGHIIVVPFSDSLVPLGINGHFYLGGIEEEVLGRKLSAKKAPHWHENVKLSRYTL